MMVALAGIGALHSGNYLVWSVRHRITPGGAHDEVRAAAQRRGRGAGGRRRRARGAGRRGMTAQRSMDEHDADRRAGAAAQPVLRQVPRRRHRRRRRARMRIKAKVPAVLADQATGWARPCVPVRRPQHGLRLPAGGRGRASGSSSRAATSPTRSGPAATGTTASQPSDATASVKAIVTKAGQKILLDDDGGTITISDQNDNTSRSIQRDLAAARRQPDRARRLRGQHQPTARWR